MLNSVVKEQFVPDLASGPPNSGQDRQYCVQPSYLARLLTADNSVGCFPCRAIVKITREPSPCQALLIKKTSLAVGQSQSRPRTATSLTNRASLARRAICAPPGGRAPIFPLTMAPLVARFGLARAGIHDPIRRLGAPVGDDMPGERSPASALQMEKRYESRTLHRPVCEAQP
jgi:hypothetical protein